jgi:hypothetical protein
MAYEGTIVRTQPIRHDRTKEHGAFAPAAQRTRPATQGIDPSHGGPAMGSACVHADMNETTVSNTGLGCGR